MATTFESLRIYMRAVLGDTDLQNLIYSDENLDTHIQLQILALNDPEIQAQDVNGFVGTLTPSQIARMVFRSCKSVIVHMADEFSYRNPVYSVTRKKVISNLLRYLEDQLYELEAGELLIRSENELVAFLQGPDRFWEAWNDAQIPS